MVHGQGSRLKPYMVMIYGITLNRENEEPPAGRNGAILYTCGLWHTHIARAPVFCKSVLHIYIRLSFASDYFHIRNCQFLVSGNSEFAAPFFILLRVL